MHGQTKAEIGMITSTVTAGCSQARRHTHTPQRRKTQPHTHSHTRAHMHRNMHTHVGILTYSKPDFSNQASGGAACTPQQNNAGLVVSGPSGCGKTAAVYACATVSVAHTECGLKSSCVRVCHCECCSYGMWIKKQLCTCVPR
jgi:Mrp family chromosome partitioning ATPase